MAKATAAVREKRFYLDVKWIIILAIVAFLVVFEVFPMLYLVYRAFMSEGSFSLEAFRRVYTYPINWSALKNTLITGGLSMIFGVMIAFPWPGWWDGPICTAKSFSAPSLS